MLGLGTRHGAARGTRLQIAPTTLNVSKKSLQVLSLGTIIDHKTSLENQTPPAH